MRQSVRATRIRHLLMGAALAVALVVTMYPAPSYASLQVADATGVAAQAVTSQAGKVTIYVLESTTTVNLGGDSDRSGVTEFAYRGGS